MHDSFQVLPIAQVTDISTEIREGMFTILGMAEDRRVELALTVEQVCALAMNIEAFADSLRGDADAIDAAMNRLED